MSIKRFIAERTEASEGSTLTPWELYEAYCRWCGDEHYDPLTLNAFGKEARTILTFTKSGSGRVRYIGIRVRQPLPNYADIVEKLLDRDKHYDHRQNQVVIADKFLVQAADTIVSLRNALRTARGMLGACDFDSDMDGAKSWIRGLDEISAALKKAGVT